MFVLFLLLAQMPVESDEVIPGGTTHIVHIRDFHFVTKENFAADTELDGNELDKEYENFLAEVKAIQHAQKELLKEHKAVYV